MKQKITGNNIKQYEEYVDCFEKENKLWKFSIGNNVHLAFFLPLVLGFCFSKIDMSFLLNLLLSALITIPSIGIHLLLSNIIINKMIWNKFCKKYPNFHDGDKLDIEDIKNELEQYKNSQSLNVIEEQPIKDNKANEMSREEKINFLNREKEFWIQSTMQTKENAMKQKQKCKN